MNGKYVIKQTLPGGIEERKPMQIVIPKLPRYLEDVVPKAIDLAMLFLVSKYPADYFTDVVLLISPGCSRGMYFANVSRPHKEYGHTPVARIQCGDKLYLYPKATLGSYKQGLPVGPLIETACCIVHELTHHVQHKRDGVTPRGLARGGELETTANEIEFLKKNFPEWHKLLMIEEASSPKMKRTKFSKN